MPRPGEDRSNVGGAAQFTNIVPLSSPISSRFRPANIVPLSSRFAFVPRNLYCQGILDAFTLSIRQYNLDRLDRIMYD